MRDYITVNTDIEVPLDAIMDDDEVIKHFLTTLDTDDITGWVNKLSPGDKKAFIRDLSECFEDVTASDILGTELDLDDALDVITQAYHKSPYLKGLIEDRLSVEKII